MLDFIWRHADAEETALIVTELAEPLRAVGRSRDKCRITSAALSFYEDYCLYSVVFEDGSGMFALADPGDIAGTFTCLDGTNGPIYELNEEVGIRLTPDNARSYAAFFFSCVRGRHGHFYIVNAPRDIRWCDDATAGTKTAAYELIEPIRHVGFDCTGRIALHATVLFQDSLWHTDMLVAQNGMIEMTNEQLLLECLPVRRERVTADA